MLILFQGICLSYSSWSLTVPVGGGTGLLGYFLQLLIVWTTACEIVICAFM